MYLENDSLCCIFKSKKATPNEQVQLNFDGMIFSWEMLLF